MLYKVFTGIWIHNVDEFNLDVNVTVCNMPESLTPAFPVPDPELHVFRIAEGGGIAILINRCTDKLTSRQNPST